MGHTSTLLPDGRVVTIGGSTAEGPVNTAEYMEPKTWLWSEITPMSVERAQHTATLLHDGPNTGSRRSDSKKLSNSTTQTPMSGRAAIPKG